MSFRWLSYDKHIEVACAKFLGFYFFIGILPKNSGGGRWFNFYLVIWKLRIVIDINKD